MEVLCPSQPSWLRCPLRCHPLGGAFPDLSAPPCPTCLPSEPVDPSVIILFQLLNTWCQSLPIYCHLHLSYHRAPTPSMGRAHSRCSINTCQINEKINQTNKCLRNKDKIVPGRCEQDFGGGHILQVFRWLSSPFSYPNFHHS